jgi:hypothetical protein
MPLIKKEDPAVREAASMARNLLRARSNGELKVLAIAVEEAVARGSVSTAASGDPRTVEEWNDQENWQYALISCLTTLAAAALGRSTGVGVWIEMRPENAPTNG